MEREYRFLWLWAGLHEAFASGKNESLFGTDEIGR